MTASAAETQTANIRQFEKVLEILERYDRNPSKLIPILQAVQKEYRYLSERVMAFLAVSLGVPPARVYGVATFYGNFALAPKGKYVFTLCDGTACHVRGSNGILEALRRKLHLSENEHTTPDGLFTVETVSCLGACGLAPVVLVNEAVHGQVTPEKAVALVEEIQEKENQA